VYGSLIYRPVLYVLFIEEEVELSTPVCGVRTLTAPEVRTTQNLLIPKISYRIRIYCPDGS
jgi:hypothetical protein